MTVLAKPVQRSNARYDMQANATHFPVNNKPALSSMILLSSALT